MRVKSVPANAGGKNTNAVTNGTLSTNVIDKTTAQWQAGVRRDVSSGETKKKKKVRHVYKDDPCPDGDKREKKRKETERFTLNKTSTSANVYFVF